MKNSVRFFLPVTAWLIISTILLTLPGSAFPEENFLDKIWFDKWVHVGMFALMTFLLCQALYKRNIKTTELTSAFLLAAGACLAYGILMEFVQKYWVSNRSFDFGDIVADGIGAAAGGIFSYKRYIKK